MFRATKSTGVILAMLCFVGVSAAQAEVVVIGHPTLKENNLTLRQVKDIWLGKTKHLADGAPMRPIDQSLGSKVRDEFYLKTLDKSPQQVKAYWARLAFTGKSEPPVTFSDDATVKSWIANHPDAVGYVDSTSVDNSVKALLKLP